MKIYADAEFTNLGSDPRLISIAFVTESDEELYIEFQSGWSIEHCSSWVVTHVIPLLGNGEKHDRRSAVQQIDAWLTQFVDPVTIYVDSSWDAELITLLLKENSISATKYPIHIVEFANPAEAKNFETQRQQLFLDRQWAQHHSLHDARVLCMVLNDFQIRSQFQFSVEKWRGQ